MERNNKVYQVIIASEANNRMYDHFEFLAHVSVNAANRLLDGLLKDIRNLRTEPFRYPVYSRPISYSRQIPLYTIKQKVSDRLSGYWRSGVCG